MTVKAFDITFKDEAVQTVNLKAGTWTFHAFVNALTYSIGLKDSTGVWHNYDLSDQTGAGWYDVQETITTDFDAVEISLLNNVGTAQVLFPMFEKGSRKSVKRPHEKDIEEAAIIKSASWEIHTSSPVIYKDAPDLTTDGAHTPVTVTGRHWVGSTMTEEGFLTVTANDETEAANASPSPVTIAPLNNADKHTYTIRLYIDANKTELLDYETIPVVFKGAKGISAIRLHINNPVDVLPADSAGNVLSFTGTGTSIHVFEGAVELDYDGAGAANGKFKVTAAPSNITMGAITDGGNICVVADATAMAADKASIVYTVTGKTLDGFDFTVSGEQNFTKTKMGQDGEGILSVIDYYGLSTSASVLPSTWYTTVPSKAANQFLWNYERIIYTDTTYDETQKRIIQGNDARSIYDIKNAYAYSASDTVSPTGGWQYSIAALGTKPEGYFLWIRDDIAYTDNPSNYIGTGSRVVRDGEDGDGITGSAIEYAKDASGTTPPNSGWGASLPSPTLGWYLWTRTTTTYKKSSATVAYSVSRYAEDGEDGDSVVHIYKQYPTKPATPSSGVANPTGWSRNPDYILSIVSQTNWAVNGKWRQSEELTATGNSATSRITFTTYKDAQTITLELWADGHATYDYVYAGKLDTAASTSNYYDRVRGGRIIITYDVPAAGSHYIDIFWRKGISTIAGSNRGYYAIINNVKVWRSATNVVGGVFQDWSEPQQFLIDTSAEERIYCLSKTTTAPAISDSDAYINDYIPLPCSLSSYRGDFATYRAYSIGQVVKYQLQYYKVIKAVLSTYTGDPSNTQYFEMIPGWTDNPTGANEEYPYEFVALRKKQSDGLWDPYVTSVWSNYAEDGLPGDPGTGVDGLRTEYYLSTSSTTQTGGTWQTTVPVWVAGTYIWERIVTVMSDLTEIFGSPYLSRTWETINQLQADIIEEQAKTQFQTTTDGGLIYTALMKLFDAATGAETAGISGILGVNRDNPSFYSGGSYGRALGLVNFLHKMSQGTAPAAGEYDALAKITMLHNGASKIGDFIIEESGRIVLVDPTTGKPRLVFGISDIPIISELVDGTFQGTSVSNFPNLNIPVGTTFLTNTINVTTGGADVSFSASSLKLIYDLPNGYVHVATIEVGLYRDNQLVEVMGYIERSGAGIGTDEIAINKVYTGMPTGVYKVGITYHKTTLAGSSFNARISGSTLGWSWEPAEIRYFQFGLNGMMAFYANNHWYFTELDGFDLRGKTNMPGVLLSATVLATGGFSNWWGAKKHASSTAAKNSTGRYTVYHSIGHSNYQVSAAPSTANKSCYIVSKGTDNFVIEWRTIGSAPALSDTGFDFQITGNNY